MLNDQIKDRDKYQSPLSHQLFIFYWILTNTIHKVKKLEAYILKEKNKFLLFSDNKITSKKKIPLNKKNRTNREYSKMTN